MKLLIDKDMTLRTEQVFYDLSTNTASYPQEGIIIDNENWVVLDIGLDPPYRMLKYYIKNNFDFYSNYINQYIDNKITYPSHKK